MPITKDEIKPLSIQQLREKRAAIVTEMQGTMKKADAEKRELTSEESAKYDEIFKDQDLLREEIEVRNRAVERRTRLEEITKSLEERSSHPGNPDRGNDPDANHRRRADGGALEKEKRWKPTVHRGEPQLRMVERRVKLDGPRGGDDYLESYRRYLAGGTNVMTPSEVRALSADSGPDGGFLQAPPIMVAQLMMALDDEVFVRRYATVHNVEGNGALGAMTEETAPSDADWTTEIQAVTADTAQKFGRRDIKPEGLSKEIQVSRTLIRRAVMPVEQFVAQRLAYKFGITEEKAFLTGDGVRKPLGIFTAHNDGIPTTRDVSTGHTNGTTIAADNFLAVKYSLKAQYQRNAMWLLHRDVLSVVARLKDAENRYIWRAGLEEGSPDMLLGKPIAMSEYAPNTITSGLYIAFYGDLSWYHIADSMQLEIQALDQIAARTNQMVYIGRKETDGMPIAINGGEAFARSKMP